MTFKKGFRVIHPFKKTSPLYFHLNYKTEIMESAIRPKSEHKKLNPERKWKQYRL